VCAGAVAVAARAHGHVAERGKERPKERRNDRKKERKNDGRGSVNGGIPGTLLAYKTSRRLWRLHSKAISINYLPFYAIDANWRPGTAELEVIFLNYFVPSRYVRACLLPCSAAPPPRRPAVVLTVLVRHAVISVN
jgi:hypothetical protein